MTIAPDRTAGERALRHICEVCGKEELLLPSEAFDGGWDYPPRMGFFGVVSARTCGDCPITETLWWALTMDKKAVGELSVEQFLTLKRIQSEPESILPA